MTLADKLSCGRIIIIPFFLFSLISYNRSQLELWRYLTIIAFILAVFTDFFDGLAARLRKEKSDLGKVIDPLADKALLLSGFLALYFLGFNIPWWLVFIVVSRDIIILVGVLIFQFLKINISISPSIWGKFTTFFQMLTILLTISYNSFVKFVWVITAVLTVISGLDYFVRGFKGINNKSE